MGSRVWVLNLDAELELAAPRAYAPSRAVLDAFAPRLAAARVLLAPGDVVLGEGAVPDGARGRAWCPTPSAARRLVDAGVLPEPWPDLDVVRRVNDRAFCAALGQPLEDAVFVRDAAAVREHLARARPGSEWLLKRAFGVAGRGQRRVRAGMQRDPDRAWVRASLLRGGLQVEPRLELDLELAVHGVLARDGALRLGSAVVQECAHGAWRATRPAREAELTARQRALLDAEARRVAGALAAEGYFGPFGVDAYLWRAGGASHLNPRSEINARYTLGWSVGAPR
jgi:hypothetical protein